LKAAIAQRQQIVGILTPLADVAGAAAGGAFASPVSVGIQSLLMLAGAGSVASRAATLTASLKARKK
jgi:hypothetical protein